LLQNCFVKKILLFGAGKSATVLIDYLIQHAAAQQWFLTVVDANADLAKSKIGDSKFASAVSFDINDEAERNKFIADADIVISMLPPALHIPVAKNCIALNKNLLTASYADEEIKKLQTEIENRQLLFLCEMGLDPGIDHMSAMKLIDEIHANGGRVISFKSHCGGLVAPESDDNPWHYKISWNPRNIVMAGKAGAVYKNNNTTITLPYTKVFSNCPVVSVDGLSDLACYANRDSLSYTSLYKLQDAATFIRTTLRYPAFCKAWDKIVNAGLTNDTDEIDIKNLTYKKWSEPINKFIDADNKELFQFLGLFYETPVPANSKTSADILQFLVETKLNLKLDDKDMIVMLHEIEYEVGVKKSEVRSSLIVKGHDSLRTAMAKTVGLPLGIAAKLILNGTIQLKGLLIPTHKEIYEPVLKELEENGIIFREQ
jgi:saccharopine dehydrogenase-like NADP-dependent oxidoreductase